MKITMVKKRLENGETCEKCVQAEEMLRRRGFWDHIDEEVWALEGDPSSEGMQLGARLGVELAPFFVVTEDDGSEKVYKSALRFIREVLQEKKPAEDGEAKAAPGARVETDALDFAKLAEEYEDKTPQEILRWGLERDGALCGLAFSGAEDVVLIDMAIRLGLDFSVFCLDTGRLHTETYAFLEKVRKHYGIELQLMAPQAEALQDFVKRKGLFSFYDDGHKECCGIRKVEPLRRALGQFRSWVTGQRRDQSPATRSDLLPIQRDEGFAGLDGPLVKLNPLAGWTSQQVWDYIMIYEVPYNELHDRGFISIGCAPCTRATRPGEHERAGRWWWEESTRRECGLHIGPKE